MQSECHKNATTGLCWLIRVQAAKYRITTVIPHSWAGSVPFKQGHTECVNALCLSCIHMQHGVTTQLTLDLGVPGVGLATATYDVREWQGLARGIFVYSAGIFVVQRHFSSSWVASIFWDKTEDKSSLSAGCGLSFFLQWAGVFHLSWKHGYAVYKVKQVSLKEASVSLYFWVNTTSSYEG